MQDYDPDKAPNPDEWLALGRQERIRLVERYYSGAGGYGGSLGIHAQVIATIETQLADKITPVKAAFMRLRDNGLGRHEAIRAIGTVLAGHIRKIKDPEDLESDANRAYFAELESLTTDTWYEGRGLESL